jgi:hypothetical protein
MNNYLVTFNYSGEIRELKTSANTHYQAILKCLSVMSKIYCVSRQSMIGYFNCEKQNMEVKEII